jgi:sialic acid synthase SpsE
MGSTVPAVAVALGACIVEKHFTKSRQIEGPDSSFSMEPDELRQLVEAVRAAEKAVGRVTYKLTEKEHNSRVFRRSLFAVKDIKVGESLNSTNVRIIRPGYGLAPKHEFAVIGRKAKQAIVRGTPLSWELID